MEQELNSLHEQFDKIIDDLKLTSEYTNYVKAKTILEACDEATAILNQIKDLQKARNSCKNANETSLVKELTTQIDKLHDSYDQIFEVAQFNYAYEQLSQKVNQIKIAIENQIN